MMIKDMRLNVAELNHYRMQAGRFELRWLKAQL